MWSFDLPAKGEGKQFKFSARMRTINVEAAPDGGASIGVEQLDSHGNPAYAARLTFEELRSTIAWHPVKSSTRYRIVTLRVKISLTNATGTLSALAAESLPAQVRINTSLGWPEDSLTVKDWQLGIFDADYRLKRVASLRTLPHDGSAAIERCCSQGLRCQRSRRYELCEMWRPVLKALTQVAASVGQSVL